MTPAAPSDTDAFLQYARRGRTAWWRYLLAGPLACALWFGAVTGLGVAAVRLGWLSKATVRGLVAPSHPVVFFLGNGLVFGALLAAFAVAVRLIQAKRFGEVAGAWRWRLFAVGAATWLAISLAGALADLAMDRHAFTLTLSPATGPMALAAAVGLGLQTLTEEWVFRGWLTQGLFLAFGRRALPAAVVSGLMFGALHIPNGWPQAAGAVVFGVAAALIAVRTGGVAFTYGLHLVNNLFGAVVIVSASDVFNGAPAIFTEHAVRLAWADVAFEAVGVALAAAVAWRATRWAGGWAAPG